MRRLLLFNNSNDLALASGMREYIPPKFVARMERDLAALPFWWADEGDAILLSDVIQVAEAEAFYSKYNRKILFTCDEEGYSALCKRTGACFTPSPWGWSKATVARYRRFGMPVEQLPHDNNIDTMRSLSSRQFAAEYIKELLQRANKENIADMFVGNNMRFLKSLDGLKISHRTIFKSPWSSSGRGIFFADSIDAPSIKEKLSGFVKRQGGFIADTMYNKQLDFALEYIIGNDGAVEFLGFSLFTAGTNGYYGYNYIASQDELRSNIVDSGCDIDLLNWLIEEHAILLKKKLSGRYTGAIGIDMLIALEDGIQKVHPCIEINLRMNIGILALSVFKTIGDQDAKLTPYVNNGFNAQVSNGKLSITVG